MQFQVWSAENTFFEKYQIVIGWISAMIRQIVCELSMIYWTNLGLLNKINSIMRNQIIIINYL